MTPTEKRAAIAAYKERKTEAGIYAVRCTASGEVWAGRTPDLSAIWNRLTFALRHGSCSAHSLQNAWNALKADAFRFEVLEQIEEEPSAYLRERVLKQRLAYWCDRLPAMPLS